ncbi:hypothetical protein AWC38_SpisGene9518 [Stylophora pistillata]|uniref:Uncharacterized protein n=1 Tax=Stylophora pistillata TaxID=50429 RepID=A0A2B4S9P9_STYPI|nr:hypothetical protein AWC38_SpisGene9518 [Stylophora pistillata]
MANVIINNLLTPTVIGAPLYKGTYADPLSCPSVFSLPALTVLRIESRKILPLSYETVRDIKKDNRRKRMPSLKYGERRYFLVQFLEDNVKFIVVDETELQRKEDKTTQAMYLDKKYYPCVVLSESAANPGGGGLAADKYRSLIPFHSIDCGERVCICPMKGCGKATRKKDKEEHMEGNQRKHLSLMNKERQKLLWNVLAKVSQNIKPTPNGMVTVFTWTFPAAKPNAVMRSPIFEKWERQ